MISENTYQKAVFQPYFRKLENTEVPSEQLQPIVREFRPYLGTEELNRISSDRISQNRDAPRTMWLLDQPGLDELPTSTMFDDWVEFALLFAEIQRIDDLQEIICYEEKSGNRYFICAVRDNDDIYEYKQIAIREGMKPLEILDIGDYLLVYLG